MYRIETLLEEAHNERMHLLTFLKLAHPGWQMRTMVLGSQCVFFSAFFLAYLLSPRSRAVNATTQSALRTMSRLVGADLVDDVIAGTQPLQHRDHSAGPVDHRCRSAPVAAVAAGARVQRALEILGDSATKPIVVRLDGNNVEEGRQILREANHPLVTSADTMDSGADKAAELAHSAK
mgnify:CR=1 FL=1